MKSGFILPLLQVYEKTIFMAHSWPLQACLLGYFLLSLMLRNTPSKTIAINYPGFMPATPINHSTNNFDFLRFFAASLVIFSHSYPLTGRPEILASHIGHETGGGLAVSIFFIISGYLITGSSQNSSSTKQYLWKRTLRIFPGFIASLLVFALLIGPWMTALPLSEYFSNPGFWSYFKNISLYRLQWELPGVFSTHPVTSPNGTCWTLALEFTMYLAIGLLGHIRLLRIEAVALCALGLYALHLHTSLPSSLIFGMQTFFLTLYGALFMAGAALYLARDSIRWNVWIFAALTTITLLSIKTKEGNLVLYLCLPYIIIYLGRKGLPFFSQFGRFGDFSYGIYLYGMAMQQIVIHYYSPAIGVLPLTALALLTSVFCAFFSWHLVEAPALRLKKRIAAA